MVYLNYSCGEKEMKLCIFEFIIVYILGMVFIIDRLLYVSLFLIFKIFKMELKNVLVF